MRAVRGEVAALSGESAEEEEEEARNWRMGREYARVFPDPW
jgi:hypothetical protein